MIKKPETLVKGDYAPAVWNKAAYTRMFDKFEYSQPVEIEKMYPDIWDFACRLTVHEHSYMQNSIVLPITSTSKNMESTPGYPKMNYYNTEEEYIADKGWQAYRDLWNNPERRRPIWWTFLKSEIIKKKKIEDDDIRMIMCTDPTFTRFGAAFEQNQNERMKNQTEWKQAQVGWTPFFGGLHRRISRLEKNRDTHIEMDWTRYDGTIPREVFLKIKEIRYFFLADKYKTAENKERYWWYVQNLMEKVVLLPTGEITIIGKGNPSGQISTTTDNNMINTFLTAFEICYQYKKQHGCIPTISDYYDNVDSICYGDDRLLSVNSKWLQYDSTIVPAMYRDIFGMWVKPENIKKQGSMEGLSFCGFTLTKVGGVWKGVPNVEKIFTSLSTPNNKLPDLQSLWGKLVSLRILVQYTDQQTKDYLEEQIERVRVYATKNDIALPEVPEHFYQRVWSGGPKNNGGGRSTKTSEKKKE
nr:MAG: nonstructural protein [Avian astrovirus 9]